MKKEILNSKINFYEEGEFVEKETEEEYQERLELERMNRERDNEEYYATLRM